MVITTNKIMLALKNSWDKYKAEGRIEQFIEFTVSLNCLTEYFERQRLAGLIRLSEGLENLALSKFGEHIDHPLDGHDMFIIERQINALFGAVAMSRQPVAERRAETHATEDHQVDDTDTWLKPRSVWIIHSISKLGLTEALNRQLEFFGFQPKTLAWGDMNFPDNIPLAVIFSSEQINAENLRYISVIRNQCPTAQLIYLGADRSINPLVGLIRAGIDITIPKEQESYGVLNCILDLVQTHEPEKSKVLIVEDSRVAVEVVQRALSQHNIDTYAITDPENLISALDSYQPDLILMDMYMPSFNGVEATRVLRQLSAYSAIPVVYISAESDVAMQVEALRLGGDQFITKPFNPVLLTAIVKTKIERFRETLRSTQIDGLTGLLNHTALKARLESLTSRLGGDEKLSVVMLDIDHFKSVNDTYGHPVGDQVIRGLAWLLKGRLRTIDLIGRYGGEEFLVALPGTSTEEAKKVINRIREDFAALPHAHQHGSLYASFSAGIASYPMYLSAKPITEAADKALLSAKQLGRNRVEVASSDTA